MTTKKRAAKRAAGKRKPATADPATAKLEMQWHSVFGDQRVAFVHGGQGSGLIAFEVKGYADDGKRDRGEFRTCIAIKSLDLNPMLVLSPDGARAVASFLLSWANEKYGRGARTVVSTWQYAPDSLGLAVPTEVESQ